jgi:hypothetical protein
MNYDSIIMSQHDEHLCAFNSGYQHSHSQEAYNKEHAIVGKYIGSRVAKDQYKTMLKYRNIRTMTDGISFASKKESKRYCELKVLKQCGEVQYFLRQVPFHLPGNVKYLCDFYVVWKNGSIGIEDVKGKKTQTYIMKKKMVEALYPIKIVEL